LLEDDNLIAGLRVTVDRLLDSKCRSEVLVVISVDVLCTRTTSQNLALSR